MEGANLLLLLLLVRPKTAQIKKTHRGRVAISWNQPYWKYPLPKQRKMKETTYCIICTGFCSITWLVTTSLLTLFHELTFSVRGVSALPSLNCARSSYECHTHVSNVSKNTPSPAKDGRMIVPREVLKRYRIPPYCGACTIYIRNHPIFQGEKSASYICAPVPVSYSAACTYIPYVI